MVSEDSQLLCRLPEVHRLCDLRDLDETRHREVPSEIHQSDDLGELGEVVSLRGSQWVLLEERNDDVTEVSELGDVVTAQILTMIVVPPVDVHLPATEELDHRFEHIAAGLTLDDGERRLHLPSEGHRAVSEDGRAEAAFPIYETHQPCTGEEPFLLVFRTPHIFTDVHDHTLKLGWDMNDE